jgi:hypothetical protein
MGKAPVGTAVRHGVVVPMLCAVLFGCVGPPVGSLAVSLPSIGSTPDPAGSIGLTALFSYLLGFIPMLATGVVSGLFLHRVRAVLAVPLCGLVGALVAYGFGEAWDYAATGQSVHSFANDLQMWALPGFGGGAACGYLASLLLRRLPFPGARR